MRRTVGFLPPDDFVAELRLVVGLSALARARNATALPALRTAWEPLWERYPDSTWARRTAVWPDQLESAQLVIRHRDPT